MTNRRVRCIVMLNSALFLLLMYAVNVGAQSSRVGAVLEGTVSDASGAVVANVTVTLRSTLTDQSRTVLTDGQGFFQATELPAGNYEVRIQHPGFSPYRHTGVDLTLGGTVRLEIILALASASEGVTVRTQPPGIDTSETSVVSSVDQERIEELPVRSRNYLDFVLLAPGVSSAPAASRASGSSPLGGSGFSFGGLRARSNNVSIDGL